MVVATSRPTYFAWDSSAMKYVTGLDRFRSYDKRFSSAGAASNTAPPQFVDCYSFSAVLRSYVLPCLAQSYQFAIYIQYIHGRPSPYSVRSTLYPSGKRASTSLLDWIVARLEVGIFVLY